MERNYNTEKIKDFEGEKVDFVNHPKHYTFGKIECIDALESATEGLPADEAICAANVIKYVWRYRNKNGAEDLAKAEWYLHRLMRNFGRKVDDGNGG